MLKLIRKNFMLLKQPIAFDLVDIDKIVISEKFKHTDKYFAGYKDDDIIRALCIVLPQIEWIHDNGGKRYLLKLKMILYW